MSEASKAPDRNGKAVASACTATTLARPAIRCLAMATMPYWTSASTTSPDGTASASDGVKKLFDAVLESQTAGLNAIKEEGHIGHDSRFYRLLTKSQRKNGVF